ncbi:MAG: DUF2256 domain-containing protein [Planctomycetota bacterium]
MANNRQQAKLSEKTCPVCQSPFRWRKKWQRDWDRVVYGSKGCAAQARRQRNKPA